MSLGSVHVTPSSAERVTYTRSLFQHINRWISPVTSSTTGAGFPAVLSPASQITDISSHVSPLSMDLRSTRSMLPSSAQLSFRASRSEEHTSELQSREN